MKLSAATADGGLFYFADLPSEEEAPVAEPWRIGVLFSETGVTKGIETTQKNGTILAIEEINGSGGVAGRPLVPVAYDPASNPQVFGQKAQRLLAEDRVRVIFGCYMSSTRKAVLPVVERYNGLLFYPTLYEGFEYSENVFYTGAAPNQNSLQLARFIIQTWGQRFYFVGSNYIYPYESNRIMMDHVRQNGGEVLSEKYVPLDASREDFEPIIEEIVRLRPDAIFSTVVGSSTSTFYRAYQAAGLDASKMPIASLTTSEAEIAEMGVDAAEGHITAAPYFRAVRTAANERFVRAFTDRFGADCPITAGAEAAYFQVHMFARALGEAGEMSTDSLRRTIRGQEFDAPQGRVRIEPDNHHTWLWPRLGRINARGRFDIIAEATAAVRPDPYLVAPSLKDWSADLLASVADDPSQQAWDAS